MSTSVSGPLVGAAVTRIDGPLKVTGKARYAVDHPTANIAYGFPVSSTIAKGSIRRKIGRASCRERVSPRV